MWAGFHRFNAEFWDSLLILIWYLIVFAVGIAAFGTVFPETTGSVGSFFRANDVASAMTAGFLMTSMLRLCVNLGFPLRLALVTYPLTLLLHAFGISVGWFLEPTGSRLVAATFPALLLLIMEIGLYYVWQKIKPRRKTVRKP